MATDSISDQHSNIYFILWNVFNPVSFWRFIYIYPTLTNEFQISFR